jgi:glucose-6-phosphate 1-epimerase
MHGFARLMFWDVTETASLPSGETLVKLQLCSSDTTKQYWPHDFCAEMTIVIGKKLTATLKVKNTSGLPLEYTCALHSYYNIAAIEEIKIQGLQNTGYYNQLDGENYTQESELLEIKNAETRHYQDTVSDCVIFDPVFGRGIHVAKTGSKVTTVWNPGAETSAKIDDIPDDGFHSFVCIEAVNAFTDVIKLAPGEAHETSVIIGVLER